ncbi:MAG: class I SAM-dependent methyltransferase [Patescibacteria group bacterium]|nr:class I SAM-dependent methyltransferase [Patescibacteria group bacterium]
MNISVKKIYNKIISERYYQESEKFRKKYGASEWQETFRLINFSLKDKRVLDAGCGFGYEVSLLHKKGAEVYGVDTSAYLIDIAKNNYPNLVHNFFVGDIKKLPFKNNFFDLIICKYVLHYLPSPDSAFKEFFRCLKKNGLLIFSVHHPLSNLFFKKSKNYFKKDKIKVEVFAGVNVIQPTHPLTDYFSKYFLEHFDLQYFDEDRDFEPLHPKINIPEYLLVKARKRNI